MKRFLRMFSLDLERAFSRRFFISILAIVLLMLIDNLWDLRDSFARGGYTVYHFFFNSIVFSGLLSTYGVAIACVMPYGQSVVQEFETGVNYQLIIRSSKSVYYLSKYVTSVISSGLCLAAGYWIFILLLSLQYPFSSDVLFESGMIQFPYVDLLIGGECSRFIYIVIYNGLLLGALYGGISVAVSLLFKDRMIVATLPFFVRFIWIQFYRLFEVKDGIRLDRRLMMRYSLNTYGQTALWSFLRTTGLLILFYIVFIYIAERRLICREDRKRL